MSLINLIAQRRKLLFSKEMASKVELHKSLEQYKEALAKKSNKLPELDDWYRNELQSMVQSRKSSKEGAYLTTTELVKLMKWKLTVSVTRTKCRHSVVVNLSLIFRGESFVLD